MSKIELTTEEKLDLIYDILEKQETRYKRALISKIIFRVLVIWFIVIFYFIILPKLDLNKIITEYIAPKMSQIIAPMAEESMKSISNNMLSWTLNSKSVNMNDLQNIQNTSDPAVKKAELLKRLKEMQNK